MFHIILSIYGIQLQNIKNKSSMFLSLNSEMLIFFYALIHAFEIFQKISLLQRFSEHFDVSGTMLNTRAMRVTRSPCSQRAHSIIIGHDVIIHRMFLPQVITVPPSSQLYKLYNVNTFIFGLQLLEFGLREYISYTSFYTIIQHTNRKQNTW